APGRARSGRTPRSRTWRARSRRRPAPRPCATDRRRTPGSATESPPRRRQSPGPRSGSGPAPPGGNTGRPASTWTPAYSRGGGRTSSVLAARGLPGVGEFRLRQLHFTGQDAFQVVGRDQVAVLHGGVRVWTRAFFFGGTASTE